MYHYFRKHKGKTVVFLLRLITFWAFTLRWLGLLMIYPFSGSKRAELRERFYAYLKVIEGKGF